MLLALSLLAAAPTFAQITTIQNKKEFFNGTEDHIYAYYDREAGRLDRLEGVWTFTKLDYDEYGNLVSSAPSGKSAIIRTSGERHRAFIEVNLDRAMCAKLRVIYNIQTGGGSNYYPTEAVGCLVPEGRYTFNPQEYTISREAVSFAGGKAYLVGVRIYPQGHSTTYTGDAGGGGGYRPPVPERDVRPSPGMVAPRKDRAITDPDGWEPFIDWGRQIFPSYIVGVSGADKSAFKTEVPQDYLGDILGVIGVAVNSPRNGSTLRIEIDSTRYFGRVSQEFKLPKKGVRYTVFPSIPWDYESLYCINAPFPYTIRYRVTINDKTTEKVVNNATMRAIDDCPLKAYDYRGELIDLRAILAGYVNEGSGELLDKVKAEILKQGTVNAFVGYQAGREAVIQQVYAFWKYLRSKDVRYSNATDNGYGDNPEVFSQRVRLLEDVMASNQANCIDGTAALASMLLSAGIDPFIVIIPGHAFLGYFTDEAHTPEGILFLETTLIGERAVNCTPPSADYLNTVTAAVKAVE
ncbi:MAG TPA: hypothetical protein PKD78_01955, partial [Saprospiraceae bacterium]|nr:hypothetical protein [Saprospiraceae bacterium]